MTTQQERDRDRRESQAEERRDIRSYVWGVGLALALTLVPFALVHASLLSRFWLVVVIASIAFCQVVVHFRFFLHISLSKQKREDLQLILFSTLLLAIMGGGTIWIMANLAGRMSLAGSGG